MTAIAVDTTQLRARPERTNTTSPEHGNPSPTTPRQPGSTRTERLVAEVKGHTTSPGLDVDTGYGQLLRRMTDDNTDADIVFALVVPESLEAAVARVPSRVRRTLCIEVWLVPDVGEPHRLRD